MTVTALVQALDLLGQVYRNRDGSQPADAIRKIQRELEGAGDMTLAAWVAARQSAPKARRMKPAGGKAETTPDEALSRLESADTQAALREAIAGITLRPDEWKVLGKRIMGLSAKSGKAARAAIETYFSDRLLLNERVESVKRRFRAPTLPPGRA